ncbi:MAG TPA: PLP-dependent aminotransferase family protein [Ktedonobacteraceae bacterium]|jgi:2-aminoadipate transaminase
MIWDSYFTTRTELLTRSAIRELLKFTIEPEIISFAGGLSAPELFPVERIRQATEGMPELRNFLARRLSSEKLHIGPEHILIVAGSQQALDLIVRVFVNERACVILENPTYLGMLQALRPYKPRYLPVGSDQHGMNVESLPPLLRQKPGLLDMVPTYQNPQGTTLSKQRRLALICMLDHSPVTLIEDNPYSELRYDGESVPLLLALDAQHLGSRELTGRVVCLGTFSKILSPGLRVGWVAAPVPVIDKLVATKQSADLHTSTFVQYIINEVIQDEFLECHVVQMRKAIANGATAYWLLWSSTSLQRFPGHTRPQRCS